MSAFASGRFRAALLAGAIVLAVATAGLTASAAEASSSSLCSFGPTTIVGPGSSTTLTGRVLTSGRSPVAGASAGLEQWYSGAWHAYDIRRTGTTGAAAWSLKPRVSVALRMHYAGGPGHGACVSGTATLWMSNDSRVMTEAASLNGRPYVFGAVGPSSFDCSGYSLYVFKHFGRTLPRTAAQQYAGTHHITQAAAVNGDLIFFGASAAGIYHMGIYAGAGYIWHASSGSHKIQKAKLWTSAYYVGRL